MRRINLWTIFVLTNVYGRNSVNIKAGSFHIINANRGVRHGRPLAYRRHSYLELRKSNPMVEWEVEPYDTEQHPNVFVLKNVYRGEYYQNWALFDHYIRFNGRSLDLEATTKEDAGKFIALPSRWGHDGLYILRDAFDSSKWLTNHGRKVHLSRWKRSVWNFVDATHYLDAHQLFLEQDSSSSSSSS